MVLSCLIFLQGYILVVSKPEDAMNRSKLIVRVLTAALILFGLAFCKNGQDESSKEGALTPEKFFAASMEFSDLNLEFKQRWLEVLEEHGSITAEAHEELRKISQETGKRHQEILEKYDLEGPDWAKHGPGINERNRYLKQHPGIKKRMEENRAKMIHLAEKINKYMPQRVPGREKPDTEPLPEDY
jgi:hypothetical protein